MLPILPHEDIDDAHVHTKSHSQRRCQLSFHDKQIKCLCMKLSDETAAIFNFIHTLHSENTKKIIYSI